MTDSGWLAGANWIGCYNHHWKSLWESLMTDSIKITFAGQLDTQKELESLFYNLNSDTALEIASQIGLVLYGYQILHYGGLWTVYRTHNQIVIFLKKYSKKFKTSLSFEEIRDDTALRNMIETHPELSQEQWFKDFFEIDFNEKGSVFEGKKKSLIMKKKAGGRYYRFQCCTCLGWKGCRVILTKDGLIVCHPSSSKVQQFMHFGKDFRWSPIGPFDHHKLVIHSYHRKMTLNASSLNEYFLFAFFLEQTLNAYKKEQKSYRFNSFAPIRYHNEVDFFVDGADYFENVALSIEQAQEEVFICGWWVSPQFHLIRPCEGKNLDYRLDNLLARVAKRGIKVYIVVYYESSFLTNDSGHTIEALQSLHEKNIKVLRHPQIILPTYWSHHEKIVMIDQEVAYMGGLDLCYGRWDTSSHLIDDNSSITYPGIEYNNCRINDFVNVKNYQKDNVIRESQPRLPWHDVTMRVRGRCTKDIARHFIEYWNYASYQSHYADRFVLVTKHAKGTKKPATVPEKINGLFDSIKGFAFELKGKIKHGKHSQDGNNLQVQSQNIKSTRSRQNTFNQNESIPKRTMRRQNYEQEDKRSSALVQQQFTQNEYMRTPEKAYQKRIDSDDDMINNGQQLQVQRKLSIKDKIIEALSPNMSAKKSRSRFGMQEDRKDKILTGDRIYEQQHGLQNIQSMPSEDLDEFQVKIMDQQKSPTEHALKTQQVRLFRPAIKVEQMNVDVGVVEHLIVESNSSEKMMLSDFEAEQKQSKIIETNEKVIRDSLIKIQKLQRKLDEEESSILDDNNKDLLVEKPQSIDEDLLERKRIRQKLASSVQSSPESNMIEGVGLSSWMKKMIKKTKKTFSKEGEQYQEGSIRGSAKQYHYAEVCQVLRSVSQWSIGCEQRNFEKSISAGYEEIISKAEKYIYIENQFFISATKKNGVVKNRVVDALCKRVIQAIQKEENFRVIIFIPLIPGFAGELDDPNATLPRVIMNWQYKSICRGPGSVYDRLQKYTKTPEKYVSFYSLRNHGVLEGVPKTQIIYIHSKLIIVDDRHLICGSANINDRSMEGNRDSQICLLIEADNNLEIKIDDDREKFMVVQKIHNLRKSLMAEHFGMPQHRCVDMIGPNINKERSKIAQRNTEIYRNLFSCYPDDSLTTLIKIKQFRKPPPTLDAYQKNCDQIQGHVVDLPLHFLEDEKLTSIHPNAIST